MKKDHSLFEEFPPVSPKQWKQQIQFDLKGLDYNETLVWQSPEGIDVKPFYTSEDLPANRFHSNKTSWKIVERILIENPETTLSQSKLALQRGAETLVLETDQSSFSLNDFVGNFDDQLAYVEFNDKLPTPEFLKELLSHQHIIPRIDVIHHLARTGNWYTNLEEDFQKWKSYVEDFSIIFVDATLYQNSGGNIVQQLAYTLAHLVEYYNRSESSLSEVKKLKVAIKIAIGGNYFFEIAKVRALRLLIKTVSKEFDINPEIVISAIPTKRNKSIYDYNNNLLRTTTECMSALLGGADEIENLPYDFLFKKPNEFSSRIARNQLLVLREESNFNSNINAAEGSYYIEKLTLELAEKSLTLFKEIEKSGGFLTQLKEGTIQRKIKERAMVEQQKFDENDLKLVGANFQFNRNEKISDSLELKQEETRNVRKTLLPPILERRLAKSLELERLQKEK